MARISSFFKATLGLRRPSGSRTRENGLLTPSSSLDDVQSPLVPRASTDASNDTSETPSSPTVPDTPRGLVYNVFGLPLAAAVHLNSTLPPFACDEAVCAPALQARVPLIVLKCVTFLTAHGLSEEGIYRVNGSAARVRKLQQRFSDDPSFDLDPADYDVHTVTSFLKSYLRHIPDDIFAVSLHPGLEYSSELSYDMAKRTRASTDIPTRITMAEEPAPVVDGPLLDAIHDELAALPEPNYALLHVLIRHFNRISLHMHDNRMTAANLSVVLSPTLRINRTVLVSLIMLGDLDTRTEFPHNLTPPPESPIDEVMAEAEEVPTEAPIEAPTEAPIEAQPASDIPHPQDVQPEDASISKAPSPESSQSLTTPASPPSSPPSNSPTTLPSSTALSSPPSTATSTTPSTPPSSTPSSTPSTAPSTTPPLEPFPEIPTLSQARPTPRPSVMSRVKHHRRSFLRSSRSASISFDFFDPSFFQRSSAISSAAK